jgi:RIO kinase 1
VPTERDPKPHPAWLVTELAAVDTELGIVKTGKEADVFLIRRAIPHTDRACLLAAKVRTPSGPVAGGHRAGGHRVRPSGRDQIAGGSKSGSSRPPLAAAT